MYRSHTCGDLRETHINKEVLLSGWVHKLRDKGFVVWVDLRDRYGIIQLVFDEERSDAKLLEKARSLGREYVIQVKGKVIERASKNPNLPTGDVEVLVSEITILNEALLPPFTIEDQT
ncbi:MAG: aspartate--tRNA ligase, partial [Eudoraea sp.]|nr:aspartate--tRNA ligase [Eudoraea sp.]